MSWANGMTIPTSTTRQGACGGLLEVGDPLEGEADYGDHIFSVGGYSYHIQDLVFLKYSTEAIHVCE